MEKIIVTEDGYIIVDDKKYKITEIEGDEIYYRDEHGIEHAVPIH